MNYRKLTVGADPEIFLSRPNGEIVPVCGLIGGTKGKGVPIISNPQLGITVHEDGAALEFNFTPVEHIPNAANFSLTFERVYDEVIKLIKSKGLHPSDKTFNDFSSAVLTKYAKQMEFGCDPDFDAHQFGAPLPRLNSADYAGLRCVGGHLHFGWDKSACPIPEYAMIQFVEALVILPAIRGARKYIGVERARMYGRPGAFRPKPYGVEYRTPSNYWIFGQYNIVERAADVLWWVINNVHESRALYDSINFSEVREAVANLSVVPELATKMLDLRSTFIEAPLKEMFKNVSKKKSKPSKFEVFYGLGAESAGQPGVGVQELVFDEMARLNLLRPQVAAAQEPIFGAGVGQIIQRQQRFVARGE